MPALNVSFVWPYYCSNLFPCDPSLSDGIAYSMEVSGYDASLTAVFPTETWTDGPAYMAGLTVGDYVELNLGETAAGTAIKAWYFDGPKGDEAARKGTEHLVAAFDYFERVYGPYAFGPEYGSVEVDWGADSWGGMEHHPYSHIGTFDMNDEEAHVHEAGHGWFGDGVRIACWEDFVLSEGTNSYITARALEQAGGPSQWAYYVDGFLTPACRGMDVNTVVLPSTCGEIDFVNDNLWSLVTYMKGACFYEDVADLIGADLLDEIIGDFYKENVNQARRMNDMLDAIRARTDAADQAELETLITEWLLTKECPEDYAARCKEHVPR
jgi:aminopeptidase N